MTLANRVSAFFLVALAIALACYSAAFYVLAHNYLNRQFDEDLQSALQILSSSVEVEPDDAKWDPAEHGIDLHQRILNEVIWVVADELGQTIDRSPAASRNNATLTPVFDYSRQLHPDARTPTELGDWRVMQTELAAPKPKPLSAREPHEYASLLITVARPRNELDTTLGRLATLVIVLPAAVWLAAAVLGRWFVNTALRPVREMADRARSMTRADFNLRLPVSKSNDELSELASTFNHLLDQLQTAFNQQHRFTGDAAHQLRTPLAVLQGQLDVALRRPRANEEYQQTLGTLSDQTAELRQIVESLLYLARTEANSEPPDREPISVDDWLASYTSHWREHPRMHDIAVNARTASTILVSPHLLTQLIDNLVSNAVKYSDPGSPITIGANKVGNDIEISVTDRGVGISPGELATIFDPFYRSESARHAGIAGTGLGLSVAARIATALGGRLSCASRLGAGSTFTLTIPPIDMTTITPPT
jgi:heavy metal sensor kinase